MLFYILKSSFKNKKTSPNLNPFPITTYFKKHYSCNKKCRDERSNFPRCHSTSLQHHNLYKQKYKYCSALFGYLHILSYDYGGFRSDLLSCSIIPDIFPDFYQTSHGSIQTPALQPHSHHRRLSLCCLMLTTPGQRLCTNFKEQLLLFNLLKN